MRSGLRMLDWFFVSFIYIYIYTAINGDGAWRAHFGIDVQTRFGKQAHLRETGSQGHRHGFFGFEIRGDFEAQVFVCDGVFAVGAVAGLLACRVSMGHSQWGIYGSQCKGTYLLRSVRLSNRPL